MLIILVDLFTFGKLLKSLMALHQGPPNFTFFSKSAFHQCWWLTYSLKVAINFKSFKTINFAYCVLGHRSPIVVETKVSRLCMRDYFVQAIITYAIWFMIQFSSLVTQLLSVSFFVIFASKIVTFAIYRGRNNLFLISLFLTVCAN